MSDDMRTPVGNPVNDEGETGLNGEAQEEVEETDEQISDDPVVEEEGEDDVSYDPAVQAPTEAER